MELKVGAKLRELRNDKKISISELSKSSEVSTGLISQVERDLVVPSVVTLWRLAQALEADINCFFEDIQQKQHTIIRHGDHKILSTQKNSCAYKLLSSSSENHLDLMEIILEGGSFQEKEALSHEGEECGYVLKGTLTVYLNGKEYTLYEGDSITFSSQLPHKYINYTEKKCVSIWAMTPCFF